VLEAYLDEAGTHRGAEMLCVAGYVGNRKEWYSFERFWSKKLKDSGISCFHAKEPDCNILKLPLAIAIEDRKLRGFIVSVRPEVYNLHAGAQLKSSLGNAYSACATTCAIQICQYAKKNKLGPVSFIYESGQPNAQRVLQVLEMLALEKPDYKIASVSLARKDEFLPLQTADFLSHSYSVRDQPWLAYLVRSGDRVSYSVASAEHIAKTSQDIKAWINHQRKMRQNLKRKINDSES